MVSLWYSEDAGRYTLLGFSIFILAGGLGAWFRRRSQASLVSSSLSAFLLLAAFVISLWWPIIAFAIGAIVSRECGVRQRSAARPSVPPPARLPPPPPPPHTHTNPRPIFPFAHI